AATVGSIYAVARLLLRRASLIVQRVLPREAGPDGNPARPAVRGALHAERFCDPGVVHPVDRDDAARGRVCVGVRSTRRTGGDDGAGIVRERRVALVLLRAHLVVVLRVGDQAGVAIGGGVGRQRRDDDPPRLAA